MEFVLKILRLACLLLENHKTLGTPSCFHIGNEKLSMLFFQIAFEMK
jgi:hypothetical protein